MRVISQLKDVDINYETSNFIIVDNATMLDILETKNTKELIFGSDINESDKDGYLIVAITQNNTKFVMAGYPTIEKAREALSGLSACYRLYLITDHKDNMVVTDGINYTLDKPFKKIDIKELDATVYYFPE